MNNKKKIASVVIAGSVLVPLGVSAQNYSHKEIIGKDRYETGAKIANKVNKYNKVILVNGSGDMADGLSASALAGKLDATILPIKKNEIPKSVKEIVDKAKEVYIVGGENAVSKGVENQLKGKKVTRISGKNRIETSEKIADYLGNYNRAYLVNGYEGEADAMSVSSVSARDEVPILLTNGKSSKHQKKAGVEYTVVGGKSVVSDNLQNKYKAERIGGKTRYDTNKKVIEKYYRGRNTRYFTNGKTLVDALSASYLAKDDGIVLVNEKENHNLLRYINTVQIGGLEYDINFGSQGHINQPPTAPKVEVEKTRTVKDDKFLVNINIVEESTDPEDGEITYEWEGKSEDDYYTVGEHTVKVRAVDNNKATSDWVEAKFEVISNNPTKPEISVEKTRKKQGDKFLVNIDLSKESTDLDNDKISYEWVGKTEDNYYAVGENTVKVRAVDDTGATSEWIEVAFTIADNKPTTPKIEAKKTRTVKDGKFLVNVDITEESTDIDGDNITYEWKGKSEDNYYAVGEHTVKVRAIDDTKAVSDWTEVSFDVISNTPTKPEISVEKTRTAKIGKFLVNIGIEEESIDSDGDTITYEWEGITEDNYYPIGENTVKVRAVDGTGSVSDWVETTFEITNQAPSKPVITRNPSNSPIAPNTSVGINAESSDPDGDNITYVWENRPSENHVYPLGKNLVRVKAVDDAGYESAWNAIMFFVADSNGNGGMTLENANSVIIEEGIEGATITSYTFNVPPVSGHSGNDWGKVRAYNIQTNTWDQIDYGTTSNGITLKGNLEKGKYSKLEFSYYTNHNCMYGKSNITYSVDYYFE